MWEWGNIWPPRLQRAWNPISEPGIIKSMQIDMICNIGRIRSLAFLHRHTNINSCSSSKGWAKSHSCGKSRFFHSQLLQMGHLFLGPSCAHHGITASPKIISWWMPHNITTQHSNDGIQLWNTVEENTNFYTHQQFEQAKKAWDLFHTLGTPLINNFKAILRMNTIWNNPVITKDIEIAEKIFGPNIGYFTIDTLMMWQPTKRTTRQILMQGEMLL